ncbi:hypothetical protein [Actinomadura sp. WMMB 499]|uniref:hypothetical protein n=1 Tax=Actinomadura sp. WMMB 499 TaxID=1219491 RepID=UPI001C3FA93F|nr:hypothetical protein [Actinomadura sp. WMMB 499]
MGTFAVTGSASGMGAATRDVLTGAGHTVIGVDLREADVIADLGTPAGRASAVAEVLARSGGALDGVAAVAGVGVGPNTADSAAVMSIDYFGPVALLDGLRPALARSGVFVDGGTDAAMRPDAQPTAMTL